MWYYEKVCLGEEILANNWNFDSDKVGWTTVLATVHVICLHYATYNGIIEYKLWNIKFIVNNFGDWNKIESMILQENNGKCYGIVFNWI